MKILLVEDVCTLREVIETLLLRDGYEVDSFETAEEALTAIEVGKYQCIVTDFKLPKMNGISFLTQVREIDHRVPSLIMTAYGSIEIAVEAMKHGASDFLVKPFEPDIFLKSVSQVIEHRRIVERDLGIATRKDRRLLTASDKVQHILELSKRVAKVDSSVFIFGESGTGKELLARHIHDNSARRDNPFVAINCAALPSELLESEFFGHEAGSFTGATKGRIGLFEYAAEGTIFLDEIGDMPKALQVKLLRALQEKEIKRVGSNKLIKANPRVIAATNYPEATILESGKIRDDLYFRLAVVSFTLPALRERPEDIHFLAEQFLDFFALKMDKPIPKLSKDARNILEKYEWKGNARELENVIERAVLLCEEIIEPDHLGISLKQAAESEQEICLHKITEIAVRCAEIEAISKVLTQTLGNKSKAAQILGVSYKTLLHKVKEYELENTKVSIVQ